MLGVVKYLQLAWYTYLSMRSQLMTRITVLVERKRRIKKTLSDKTSPEFAMIREANEAKLGAVVEYSELHKLGAHALIL